MALWILLGAVIFALGIEAAAVAAMRSTGRIWLRHWTDRRNGRTVGTAVLDDPDRLLGGATSAVTMAVVIAGIALGTELGDNAENRPVLAGVFLASAAVFGRWLPRAIARRWATQLAPVLIPILQWTAAFVEPLRTVARAVARRPDRASPREPLHGQDIEEIIRQGEIEGVGEPEEMEIISGVMQFGDTLLRDVMTPRTAVFAVYESDDPREITRRIAASEFSRVPVCRGSLDEIVGILHVIDVLNSGGDALPPIRQVAFAPGSKLCSEMLFEMLRAQRHFAVVLDEFGGTAGIVTLEDLLEELVGEIRDEHDEPDVIQTTPAPKAMLLAGSTALSDVAQRFEAQLPDSGDAAANTLGGLLTRAAGRIPTVGERFRVGSLEATVVETERTRVVKVLIQRAESSLPLEVLPGR